VLFTFNLLSLYRIRPLQPSHTASQKHCARRLFWREPSWERWGGTWW
jgi:hypothetical protein